MKDALEQAERRIEQARATQAEILDLGDLGLRQLPASLRDLPYLKALFLGKVKASEAGKHEYDRSRAAPQLTDLAPLTRLQGLQRLELQYCSRVTDLSPLARLPKLQRLGLSGCKGIADFSQLAGLQGLQSLGLTGIRMRDLTPLAGLHDLQSLNLANTGVTDLSPLAGLPRLQRLDLSETDVVDLAPLARLHNLQSLDLQSTPVTDLRPIAGLHALRSLILFQTGVQDLAPLAGLQKLRKLDLSGCKSVTDLSPLAGLEGLRDLDLASTGVTDVAPLAGLRGLVDLNLSNTGVTDLAPLVGLQELEGLNLGDCYRLTDVAPLAKIQSLRDLTLSSTGVRDLAPLSKIPGLRHFSMIDAGWTDLSPLTELQELWSLDLFESPPAIPADLLRAFADLPHLKGLYVSRAVGVPREVLSRKENDSCLPRLRAYFAEIDLGSEPENEVKVILLGNGRAGKTQLCRRFRGQPFDESIESTHGIQLWRETLRLRTAEDHVFQVNWWDFGGQDIYHGTHALFLNSRAIFVILWTPWLENREEHTENGIPLRNRPLAYWLDYVRYYARYGGAPVIVVQSQCDRIEDQRPLPQGLDLDNFSFLATCSYSAREDLGREALEEHLRAAIRSLLERSGALAIGHGRAEARRRLYAWHGDDQERRPEERRHRTLTIDEFRALCDEVGNIVDWEHALDYFHQTGVVFYQHYLFSDRIILDQTWALDAVYAVFHRSRVAPWLRESGRFTRGDLARRIWQEHSPKEQKLFLGLMEGCNVCFPCGATARGETLYLAPDLLPGFEAVADRVRLHWKEEPGTPILRLEYRFFRMSVIRHLMSTIGQRKGALAEYWRYGLWMQDEPREIQLLVQLEDIGTDEAPGAGALVLKAQGRDPLSLLREVHEIIVPWWTVERPTELLMPEGH